MGWEPGSHPTSFGGNPADEAVAVLAAIESTGPALRGSPNPFNAETMISYVMPKDGDLTLKIYDVLGRQVATLFDGFQRFGQHSITWRARADNGEPLASGTYFCRMITANSRNTVKLSLVK